MRIELKYRKVHKACKGTGDCPLDAESHSTTPNHDRPLPCGGCDGKGYTEETMEFEYEDSNSTSVTYKQIDGENRLILYTYNRFKWDLLNGAYGESIPNFNPQSLHFIEEKECPECKNYIYKEDYDCQNCTDGKIEVETSFTVFQSQEEYDREIRKKLTIKIYKAIKSARGKDSIERTKNRFLAMLDATDEFANEIDIELNSEQETNEV